MKPSTQNRHIPHVEDLFLDLGMHGLYEAVDQLRALRRILEGSETDYKLSTKYDGAPSLVCGIHPKTKKFFVGTKAVFNQKNPKICYNIADIMYYYPDNPNLGEVLHLCLHKLRELGITNVLQGDLMYTKANPSTSMLQWPSGYTAFTFTPNTVTYAIPYYTDLANKIMGSKLGIIFHTEYNKDWNAKSHPDLSKLDYSNKDVWFRDASFTMTDPRPCSLLDLIADELEDRINKIDPSVVNKFSTNSRIKTLTNLFFNHIIREDIHYKTGAEFVVGLNCFIHERLNKEIDAASKTETKYKKLDEKDEIFRFLYLNHDMLSELFEIVLLIVIEKHLIIDMLNGNENSIKTLDGKHEGYVLSDQDNHLTKWVNRREFSARNFANKKWEE